MVVEKFLGVVLREKTFVNLLFTRFSVVTERSGRPVIISVAVLHWDICSGDDNRLLAVDDCVSRARCLTGYSVTRFTLIYQDLLHAHNITL